MGAFEHWFREEKQAVGSRSHFHFQDADLGALVRELEPSIRRMVGPSIELEVEAATGLPLASVDRPLVREAVMRLVENAYESVAGKGDIRIRVQLSSVSTQESFVAVVVQDSGPGVPAEVRARLCEPLVSTKGPGRTGLGLATVDGIARTHLGFVRLEDGARGASFVLAFPPRQETAANRLV